MKYFYDCEFIEGLHKPLFGKRRHFIDLISIGIVAEDGREYYAISTEFKSKDADQWVKDNVISKLPDRHVNFYDSPKSRSESLLWKSNDRIAQDIIEFVNPPVGSRGILGWINDHNPIADGSDSHGNAQPEFYSYYADYDWVLLCSLFGRMIDLPKGFPMYCRDLKQTLDEVLLSPYTHFSKEFIHNTFPEGSTFNHRLHAIKEHPLYPKQTNEHNALADARWNFELYKFLQII